MRLIVGLGNPGREYVGTRHNVGFEVIDAMAARLGWVGSAAAGEFEYAARQKFAGLSLDGSVSLHGTGGAERLMLLKPTTYMNLSGRSVQEAMAFHKLEPADVMVVLDEMALPCGTIRIKAGGSSGGHNGLKDIERALGTSQYPRLRVGVDPAPPRVAGRDYVLGRFTATQRERVDPAIRRSTDALLTWIEQGIGRAMNVFNTEDQKKSRESGDRDQESDER
jgi:PTH1 family peptidyl-tRNA hydrolase